MCLGPSRWASGAMINTKQNGENLGWVSPEPAAQRMQLLCIFLERYLLFSTMSYQTFSTVLCSDLSSFLLSFLPSSQMTLRETGIHKVAAKEVSADFLLLILPVRCFFLCQPVSSCMLWIYPLRVLRARTQMNIFFHFYIFSSLLLISSHWH